MPSPIKNRFFLPAALCAAAALLSACGTTYRSTLETAIGDEKLPATVPDPGDDLAAVVQTPQEAQEAELMARRSIAPGFIASGPIAIDVLNNKGGVEIRVDPKVEKITIIADVHVSGDVEKELREEVANSVSLWAHMEKVEIDSSSASAAEGSPAPTPSPADPGAPPPVLRVRAESPDPGNPNHGVSLKITMPRCDGVRVQADGGNIILVNVAGAIQADNKHGAIELRTAQMLDAPIALTTDTGNIYFQAPPTCAGRFDLRSLDGYVTFSTNLTPKQVYLRRDVYRGIVNDGVNPIVLQSDSGNVRAWIRDDPIEFTRLFK